MNSLRLRVLVVALVIATAVLISLRFSPAVRLAERGSVTQAAASSSAASLIADPAACLPANATPSVAFSDAVAARARREEALARVRAFDDWQLAWRRADAAAKPALAVSGEPLAQARRAALKHLIETDPKRALEVAVPVGLRAELPAAVQAQLERRVDQRGALEVSISHTGAAAHIEREARIDGETMRAFVFGRREQQPTKFDLPLHGIAVDGALAVAEAPFRVLDDTEKAALGVAPEATALLIGGRLTVPASATALAALEARLLAAEALVGPQVAELHSGSPSESATPGTAEVTSPPNWINGIKRVLWLRIDFSDDPGASHTEAEIQVGATANNDFYVANSQGKTSFTATVLPQALRMPRPKSYYESSGSTNGELYTAAYTAAKAYDAANGATGAFDPDRFDRYVVLHKRIATYLYGGVAQLGGPRVGLNNAVGGSIIAHELGHTQSLAHSHYWLPSGTSAVGSGAHVEYGDLFDVMGAGFLNLNVSQKAKLGYLDNAAITTVTTAGTYRINRHDDLNATGLRALKIAPADLGYEYWIEHRRNAPSSFNAAQTDRLRNGVLLHWGVEKSPKFTTGQGSYLLDATPGSAGGANDAPFRIGETFVDPDAGITIKPLAVGGAAPAEYMDVQVSFGAIDGNGNPTLIAEAPSGPLNARTNIVFNAGGTDPDGDPIYFRWDFGDGTFQPNLASITRRFNKGGTYSLRVSSHDGKGGILAKTLALTVSDPLLEWTPRTSGVVNSLYAAIYAGGKFVVTGDNGAVLSSPDGITWTRNTIVSNAHFYRGLAHNGARFATVGVGAANAAVRATAAYSNDGSTWLAATVPQNAGFMNAAAFGAGRFIAVGETGRIYNSVDGIAWTEVSSPVTNSLRAVHYAENLFVAVGDAGRIVTSPDGIAWTNRSAATGNSFAAVVRHQNLWQTSTSTAECFTSADAVTWTRVASAGRTNNTQRMISTGGVLLTSTANGGVAFAEEPRSWSQHQIDATAGTTLFGIAEGAGRLVVTGVRGTIYTAAAPAASPVLRPPALRLEADSIKLAVGKKNILAVSGTGFVKVELYANGSRVSEINGTSGAFTWTPATIGSYLLTVRGIDATGASVVSAVYPAVAAFDGWRWRNPSPVGADLRGAVRVDGKWWIIGGGGTLLTLDDAGNLTPVDFPTTQNLSGIAYANGRFVIATTDLDGATKEDIGGLWTSPDGYTWTPFLTGVLDSANLNTVIYAANRWIGLGANGTIVTSVDGVNWPRATSGITQQINAVTSGLGLVVAVGLGGQIITSPDGLAWTVRPSGLTTDLRGVTFANATFVAVGAGGQILTSANGTTWTNVASGTAQNLYGIAFVNDAFVAGGDTGAFVTSRTGATWTAASLNGNSTGTLFIASSSEGSLLGGRGGDLYRGGGATSWTRLYQGTAEDKQAVVYAADRFVAVGGTTDPRTRATFAPVQVSADGVAWTRAAANTSFSNLTAVTYGQAQYVAVGPNSAIFTSPDANTWTRRTVTFTAALSSVAAGPAAFVAGSSGSTLYSSPDGIAWTQRTFAPAFSVRGAAYGNGRFVVVGDGGNIRHSADGTTWTAAPSGVTTNLLAIKHWDDVGFIATGNAGTIISSTDGITWQLRESGVAESIGAITRTPIGFVAAGGAQGTLLVSLDAISWSLSAIPVDKTIRGLAASSSAIVAVGDAGSTLVFELGDSGAAPVILAQPESRAGIPGETVRFSVSAQNAAGAVYQWLKDGVPIAGANSPVFSISAATPVNAGAYTVLITAPTGTVTSAAANLLFAASADPGRLINLSILTALAGGSDNFTFGVVVGGAGTVGSKPLLVRAAGPSLTPLGVVGAHPDPRLEFFTGTTKVGENDNWGGAPAISATMAQVGAFAFVASDSRDAAISLPSLASGPNSAVISGTGSGTLIAELYDATPSGQFTQATPRLINVSVLKNIGSGVTAGFVIGGSTSRTVLIRAIGPTLTGFGVGGAVADPRLTLFSGQTQIGTNDNWGGGATLAAAFTSVGAFTLPAGSLDAALVATLQPGAYTVQVAANGATGVALVEVYEVP